MGWMRGVRLVVAILIELQKECRAASRSRAVIKKLTLMQTMHDM